MNCPCHNEKPYEQCCAPFHKKESFPKTALELMRSRYSAYALEIPDYIMDTTHPEGPLFQVNQALWRIEILQFCKQTLFQRLEIVETSTSDDEAFVTFIAYLKQDGKDVLLKEKSRFIRVTNQWYYNSGKVS